VPALTSGDGYTLWHGQVSARLHERMVVFLRGDNLTNVEYMEPLGYPAWRRSLRAGLRVTF
jgi:outer membrane receptor protein involved in Fe transport